MLITLLIRPKLNSETQGSLCITIYGLSVRNAMSNGTALSSVHGYENIQTG
jgi:hypothetical protein